MRELVELGLPYSVEAIAKADASLALAVLSHCRFRFSPLRVKPVKTKAGYIVGCFHKPLEYGFNRDAEGKWHPPKGESGNVVPQHTEQGETAANAAYERWLALPDEVKEKVHERALKAFPFYQHADKDDVLSGCVKMMRQMEDEGELPKRKETRHDDRSKHTAGFNAFIDEARKRANRE
jgi:hypothetical protein